MDHLTVFLGNVIPLKNYIQCQPYTCLNMKGKRKENIIDIPALVSVPEKQVKTHRSFIFRIGVAPIS